MPSAPTPQRAAAQTPLLKEGQSTARDARPTTDKARADPRLAGCWTHATELVLDGFTYDRFGGRTQFEFDLRRDWLRRRWLPPDRQHFSPGPWDQLQRVYAQNGHDDDARRAAIEKHRHRIDAGDLHWVRSAWQRVLGATIGFGYRPALAGVWAIAAIAALAALVWLGRDQFSYVGRLNPPDTFTTWTALGYAADVFIPVGDLKVVDNWQVRGWLEPVRYLFVTLGWLLGTLFVAGFTRIVRR